MQPDGENDNRIVVRRRHVKSGCRTCKIRKVKCDEVWPACNRCISTGRICDGYGVWGGGGNHYGQRASVLSGKHRTASPQRSISAQKTISTAEEKVAYDWFLHRTAVKIPGCFTLDLWEFVVLPASLSQEIVLHALLSVSYAHYKGTKRVEHGVQSADVELENERRLLQHYVKAIQALSSNVLDKETDRVTLITCLLFTYLELLRGHFRVAQRHMTAGLRILHQVRRLEPSPEKHNDRLVSQRFPDDADGWIFEAFSRLYVQVCLLAPASVETFALTFSTNPPLYFTNINEAWKHLESILCNIAANNSDSHQSRHEDHRSRSQEERRADFAEELSRWHAAFYQSPIHDQTDERKAIATLMLLSYYVMATIMVETCFENDEMQFDRLTGYFLRILKYSSKIWNSRSPTALPGHLLNMPRSIVDIGWIPPLYYTAIKCRHLRIRLHAVRLLESTSHREGFWDAQIATKLARTVIAIEENAARHYNQVLADYPFSEVPAIESLGGVSLPADCRVSVLKVFLPDSPEENAAIRFDQARQRKQCQCRIT